MRSRKRGSRRAIELLFILLVICGLTAGYAAAENWDISEIDGDGIDNDGDGYTDSDDTECPSHYEGYGIQSTGGQGGRVYWVDISLGDLSSDPRSGTHADPCGLRKALEATGTRVVKFINGGTITLNSGIRVRYGNITIDGFTCPSPGVTITHTAANHGGISLTPNTGWHQQNYILNHLKFDGLQDVNGGHVVGWGLLGVDGDIGGNKLSRMILDHLTLRDLEDKFTLWGAVETVTLSNSLFYNSGLATLISFYGATYDLLRTDISYHHNVWAENGERNPQLRGWIRNLDYVNNVIFDWDHYEGHPGWGYGIRIKNQPGEESIYANIINNYFYQANSAFTRALIYGWDPGPDYADGGPVTKQPQGTVYTGSDMGQLWVAGNILPPQNIDEYSTIPGPLPIPAAYQVTTVPATQLYLTAGQVGMQYRDARDDAVIGRVIAAIAPDIQIVNREIFYNNCAFDGDDPAANASDDGAIATDKQPLLSGNVATFANYTSYWRGINGIMVDIDGLSDDTPLMPDVDGMIVAPTAADFQFKVGNDSTPSGWTTAPAPTSVTIRVGAGAGGSDRITIIWADNDIANQWLEVTAKTSLGIPVQDVFYFGNAIGETGNSPIDAEVTPTDQIGVRNNPHTLGINPAGIPDEYDFNRDRKVGPSDQIICRNNGTNSQTALQLIVLITNQPPTVNAGPDDSVRLPQSASLDGTVSDDGYPIPPGAVSTTWSKLSGPGTVTFDNAAADDTTAAFSQPGTYVLRLMADDGGGTTTSDQVTITVNPPASEGAFQESDGQVVIEAENFDTNDTRSDPSGENYTFASATGGYVDAGYMYPASEDTNNSTWANAAECTYEIDFINPGTYTIWLRRHCEDDGHNSCFVGTDGMQVGGTADNTNSGFGSWYWYQHDTTVSISAGRVTFNLRRREQGYKVDRIVITKNGNTPSGAGPPESPRS